MKTRKCNYCGRKYETSDARFIYCSPLCEDNAKKGIKFDKKSSKKKRVLKSLVISESDCFAERYEKAMLRKDSLAIVAMIARDNGMTYGQFQALPEAKIKK